MPIAQADKVSTVAKCRSPLFYSSKLREFADNNSKFDENGRKFPKRLENTEGKALQEQFLLSPHCFQNTCPADK